MKKYLPLFLAFFITGFNAPLYALSQEEAKKGFVKSLLHEMFAEEEKKYPALKAHLDDESKKTFQEAYKVINSKPPSQAINYIRGSKQWYINNTGIAEIISAPRITTIVPADKIEPGNMLTILGENLQGAREVTFNGVKGSISVSEPGVIRVIVPNVEGQTRIYAVTPSGTAKWDYCNVFKPKPLPVVQPPPIAKPTPPPPPPEKPKEPDKVTKNALGNPEFCFGAVGKGCGGFGDLKDDETKATRPGSFTAGCSEEVGGMRRCWVVPGSIKHDNCCVKYSSGKHCGGPGRNPFNRNEPDKDWITGEIKPAGEFNHDGNCEKEWDDAVWDVKNGRGWEADFVAKEPGNLTPATSPRGRYSGGETAGTVNLCAEGGQSISARHSVAFCCSRNAKEYWTLGVENWWTCEPEGSRSVQQIGGKREGIPTQLDMSKVPSKPGQPKQQPVAVAPKPKMVITGFEPKEGGAGTKVTLRGENLGQAAEAVVGCDFENAKQKNSRCKRITLEKKSEKEVVLTMPSLNVVAPIVLYHPTEKYYVASPTPFTPYLPPVVKTMEPPNPRAGESAMLRGENLFAITSITVTGKPHRLPKRNKVAAEGYQLDIGIPKDAQDGEIVVTTKGGTVKVPLKLGRIIPIISRVDPGKAVPGTVVSLYGQNLGHLKSILIGEKVVSTVGKGDNNSVLVTVPDSPPGKYEVTVNGQEGSGKWKNRFEILESPVAKAKKEAEKQRKLAEEEVKKKAQEKLARKQEEEKQKVLEQAMRQRQQEEALRQAQDTAARKQREIEERGAPPPPPPEPEVTRQEPQEEEAPPHCERGTWSPTLRICVEEQAPEEAAPPDCGAGMHWSPTLRSCQPD